VSMSSGMICPKGNAEELIAELDKIHRAGMDADLAENGKAAIIKRELGNHEAQITHDFEATYEVLKDYPITIAEIQAEWPAFFKECVENDWF